MLKPLQEFVCDVCDRVIDSPQKGMLNANSKNSQIHDWQIVHHKTCDDMNRNWSMHLDHLVGIDNVGEMINHIHPGPVTDPTGKAEVDFADNVKFAEVMRRLYVPYYEEARRYFDQAVSDGILDGNSSGIVSPKILKNIIERYS